VRDIIKPAVILFLVCIIVAISLAFTYSVTKIKIDERATQDALAARKEVLTMADSFEKINNTEELIRQNPGFTIVKEAYRGIKDSEVQGYVFSLESEGYGGTINITVGINSKGELSGIIIGQNRETPGLGSKAKEAPFKSQLTNIKPEGPLTVIKGMKSKPEEVEAISGATITSKAVVRAVQAAIDMSAKLVKKEGL